MTEYVIADTEEDYKRVKKLISDENVEADHLIFPTVMAIQNGELVGVLGTQIDMSLNVSIAGPLVIKSDRPRNFTLIRLVEHYELIMRYCGLSSFIFRVDPGNQKWIDKIKEVLNMAPYDVLEDGIWFRREL